jgi:hypothetical protein
MKININLQVIIFILLASVSCEKASNPPYAKLEKLIRNKYDKEATFSWSQYTELLNKLKEDKFIVLPINEMRYTFIKSKVVVGLRHDVDFNPFKALEMEKIEKEKGIRSTYYILATGEYYGHFGIFGFVRNKVMNQLYKELYNDGAEIGIHNDLLTVMIAHNMDPFRFNKNELAFYKSLNIPIHGTVGHGSQIAKNTVPNYMIFSDYAKNNSIEYGGKTYPLGQHSLKEYGYEYEANYIDFNIYFSDSRGKWNDPMDFKGILNKLDSCKAGDRIQILAHPDWWGK